MSNYACVCRRLLMLCTQVDEDREAVSDGREAFVELQNALQCIIASFVEFPEVATEFLLIFPSKPFLRS